MSSLDSGNDSAVFPQRRRHPQSGGRQRQRGLDVRGDLRRAGRDAFEGGIGGAGVVAVFAGHAAESEGQGVQQGHGHLALRCLAFAGRRGQAIRQSPRQGPCAGGAPLGQRRSQPCPQRRGFGIEGEAQRESQRPFGQGRDGLAHGVQGNAFVVRWRGVVGGGRGGQFATAEFVDDAFFRQGTDADRSASADDGGGQAVAGEGGEEDDGAARRFFEGFEEGVGGFGAHAFGVGDDDGAEGGFDRSQVEEGQDGRVVDGIGLGGRFAFDEAGEGEGAAFAGEFEIVGVGVVGEESAGSALAASGTVGIFAPEFGDPSAGEGHASDARAAFEEVGVGAPGVFFFRAEFGDGVVLSEDGVHAEGGGVVVDGRHGIQYSRDDAGIPEKNRR